MNVSLRRFIIATIIAAALIAVAIFLLPENAHVTNGDVLSSVDSGENLGEPNLGGSNGQMLPSARQNDSLREPNGANVAARQGRPVPILMFHRVMPQIASPYTDVTPEQFREFLAAMQNAGYSAVSFGELIAYVGGFGDLPPRPFLITFDDGYLCNYELAFPILMEMELPAIINVVGARRGADTYDGRPSTPHFTWEQARTMRDSGFVEIGNHTYNLHGRPNVTMGRVGFVQLPGESEADFVAAISQDILEFNARYYENFGGVARVFAYPFGWWCEITERVLAQHGYDVTLLTGERVSLVRRGAPETLFGMYRINVNGNFTNEDLLELVEVLSEYALNG